MTVHSESNKRIAKNTLLLYLRMVFMTLINLYTSRVVLNTLGVEDFGINNVVGGVIAMLGFLTSSLGGTSSRYITFNLGKGNMELMKKTFGNILSIHLILSGIIILIGETIGLWFMTTQLQIPAEREIAAFWVYQFSILTSVIAIISVPYNATIIAHEKMSAFAYISIIDAILKLISVFFLVYIPYDKLILYAAFMCVIQILNRTMYSFYCSKHFEESHSRPKIDKNLFKKIFIYAGWTMNANLAVMGYTQGLNILLNIFFGPAVNAARGIAVQVQNAAQTFCTNFQMALNPQLTKSYATGDLLHMQQLLKNSSKISFYLMLFISLPIMLEANMILKWWLGIVPDYTVVFLRLILCNSLLFTLAQPIVISIHATGNIKRFQIIEGSMLLSIVPIAYLLLYFFHIRAEFVFLVHIGVEILTQVARVYIVLPMISLPIKQYINSVIYPIFKVIIIAPIIPIIVYNCLPTNITSFFIVCITSVCSIIFTIYLIGITKEEQTFVKEKTSSILNKIINKHN